MSSVEITRKPGLLNIAERLARCQKGLAAIEFGLIAPIMATMFLGTVEFSQAITADRRVTQVASATADLVARQKSVTTTTLDGYMQLVNQLMLPFDDNPLKLTILNVYATTAAPDTPKVCWFYHRNDGGTTRGTGTFTAGQNYTLPAGIVSGGTSVIVVEASYDYTPITFSYFIKTSLPMGETFYLKPRLSASVQLDSNPNCV